MIDIDEAIQKAVEQLKQEGKDVDYKDGKLIIKLNLSGQMALLKSRPQINLVGRKLTLVFDLDDIATRSGIKDTTRVKYSLEKEGDETILVITINIK
jgi:hypothetical protein